MDKKLIECYNKALLNILREGEGVVIEFEDELYLVCKRILNTDEDVISIIPVTEVTDRTPQVGEYMCVDFTMGSDLLH